MPQVMDILEILEGWMSTSLDGVAVLWTMVEWRVQQLKQRATLLCDYSEVEDLTRETKEMLEVSEVGKWVREWSLLGPLLRLNVWWGRSR